MEYLTTCFLNLAFLSVQAVSPFIDPVTKQKIVFVDKGPKEAEEMNGR